MILSVTFMLVMKATYCSAGLLMLAAARPDRAPSELSADAAALPCCCGGRMTVRAVYQGGTTRAMPRPTMPARTVAAAMVRRRFLSVPIRAPSVSPSSCGWLSCTGVDAIDIVRAPAH